MANLCHLPTELLTQIIQYLPLSARPWDRHSHAVFQTSLVECHRRLMSKDLFVSCDDHPDLMKLMIEKSENYTHSLLDQAVEDLRLDVIKLVCEEDPNLDNYYYHICRATTPDRIRNIFLNAILQRNLPLDELLEWFDDWYRWDYSHEMRWDGLMKWLVEHNALAKQSEEHILHKIILSGDVKLFVVYSQQWRISLDDVWIWSMKEDPNWLLKSCWGSHEMFIYIVEHLSKNILENFCFIDFNNIFPQRGLLHRYEVWRDKFWNSNHQHHLDDERNFMTALHLYLCQELLSSLRNEKNFIEAVTIMKWFYDKRVCFNIIFINASVDVENYNYNSVLAAYTAGCIIDDLFWGLHEEEEKYIPQLRKWFEDAKMSKLFDENAVSLIDLNI